MAEKQTAEDDDDEGFGDFKFVTSPQSTYPNPTFQFPQTKSLNFTQNKDDDDDDEWGDFIDNSSPISARSELPGGITTTRSIPSYTTSNLSKPTDPFSFVSNHSSPVANLNRVESEKKLWVKPQGAFPLSLFGDVEEEEEKEPGSGGVLKGGQIDSFDRKQPDSEENGSILNIHDMFSNSVKGIERINVRNGVNSSSNGIDSILSFDNEIEQIKTDNELNLRSNGLNSNPNSKLNDFSYDLNGLNEVSKVYNQSKEVKVESRSLFEPNGFNLNSNANGSDSNNNLVNEDFDEDDGWEFQGAESGAAVHGDLNSKVDKKGQGSSEVARHTSTELNIKSDFKPITKMSQNGFLINSLPGVKQNEDVNGYSQSDVKIDSDENIWDFKNAFAETDAKHKQSTADEFSFISVSESAAKQNQSGSESFPLPINGNIKSNEGFWEFKDAFAETDARHKQSTADEFSFISVSDSATKQNQSGSESFPLPINGSIKSDESFWEFKDVFAETDGKHKQSTAGEFSFISVSESTTKQNLSGSESFPLPINGNNNSDEKFWEFKDAFADTDAKDKQSLADEFSFISGSESSRKQNRIETFSLPTNGNINSDEHFWEFKSATSEIELKHEEETGAGDFSRGGVYDSSFDDQLQTSKTVSENKKGVLPLSLFSEENIDSDDSFNLHDDFAHKPPPSIERNGISSHSPSISFDDLISDLYSQAEKTPSVVDLTQQASISELDSIQTVLDSNLVNNEDNEDDEDDEDFDDASWDFKDALSATVAKDPIVFAGNIPVTKSKAESYVQFYAKLKDELCHIAYFHLDNLKKAKTAAALSCDDAKVEDLDTEIKEIYNQLIQENILIDVQRENHHPRSNSLNELLGALHEPMFQQLESEYNLSIKLQLAEKDCKSVIALLNHAVSMLKILNLGSVEEQSDYVSAWSKMISVCAQELRHGASILTHASHKNIYHRVMSDLRGQQFVVAHGEIYRIIAVLGAAAKLYKPWILSKLEYSTSIFDLLNECSNLWSSSGLEEALQSISDPFGSEYERASKALLESIKHVHDLDAHALQHNFLVTNDPPCRLSLLSQAMVPGINLVAWNGERYFVTLANLWANLIDSDPPNLPQIHFG